MYCFNSEYLQAWFKHKGCRKYRGLNETIKVRTKDVTLHALPWLCTRPYVLLAAFRQYPVILPEHALFVLFISNILIWDVFGDPPHS